MKVSPIQAYRPEECSAIVRERVQMAREWQRGRGTLNARLPAADLIAVSLCDGATGALLKNASERFALSARVQHKILRVARTIADLAASDIVTAQHVAEAVALRDNTSVHR